jgi:hypothetical protein
MDTAYCTGRSGIGKGIMGFMLMVEIDIVTLIVVSMATGFGSALGNFLANRWVLKKIEQNAVERLKKNRTEEIGREMLRNGRR